MYIEDIENNENHLQWLLDDPSNLLSTDAEFEDFLSLSDDKKELQAFLNVCNKNELYEWSSKIYSKILKLNELV